LPPRLEGVAGSPVVGPSKPRLLEILGPGLISGAADDDPSAIATYSQAGARFGYGLCWLMPLVYPLMVVVQQVSARVGRTTGHGIAGNIRRHCPTWLLYVSVTLLLTASSRSPAAKLVAEARAKTEAEPDAAKITVPMLEPFFWMSSTISPVAATLRSRSSRQRQPGSPRAVPGRSPPAVLPQW
jgi:hypothetical protein